MNQAAGGSVDSRPIVQSRTPIPIPLRDSLCLVGDLRGRSAGLCSCSPSTLILRGRVRIFRSSATSVVERALGRLSLLVRQRRAVAPSTELPFLQLFL